MSTPFDLLLFGRQKLAAETGSSPTHQTLTKVRLRIVQQVFNNRRLVYRNRIEANRRNFVVSTIENAHKREQVTQRIQKENLLTDLKQKNAIRGSCLTLLPYYEPINLTEPKDFYRFGVRVQSAGPHIRSRSSGAQSQSKDDGNQYRSKSASKLSRSNTAPPQIFYPDNGQSDDETMSISDSRITSSKSSNDQALSLISGTDSSQHALELTTDNNDKITSSVPSIRQRITWPIRLKLFTLQDEDEVRQQFLIWRAEKRRVKSKESSRKYIDVELERQYHESIRRRKEIELFVTSDLIEEHKKHDPIFAKRHRQLELAVRTGKIPNYDPKDREININMTTSRIERARTAIITAKQSQKKNFYENQQTIHNAKLSKRIDSFLKCCAKINEEQEKEF